MKDGCMILKQNRWSIEEQILFLNRLGMLLEEGYAISDAISFIQIQLKKDKYAALSESIEKLKNGEKFYKVLEEFPFHSTAVSFTFYGEQNGQLSKSLKTAAIILKEREKRKRKIQKLLVYPVFLLVVTGGMFSVISWQLLPQFMQLYNSFQAEPGFILRLLDWVHEHPLIISTIILSICMALTIPLSIYKKRKTSFEIQYALGRIPLLGHFFQLWNTYYMAYHTSQLLKSGLSLFQSLKFLKEDPKKPYLKEAVEKINEGLLRGENFSTAVRKIPFWKREIVTVIEHGQLVGKLEVELEAYSQYCLEVFFERLEKVIKIIQPMIFAVIALWIIFMYFSIMLPSFQLINYI